MSDIKFVDGLIAKKPHDNAPDFVKCALSIKREELIQTLQGMSGEWVNVDVKEAKSGKWYAAVNDYKPEQKQAPAQPADDWDDTDKDLPF